MRSRPPVEFESAMTLMEAGRGDSEIARMTGIPRGTISAWRHGRGTAYHVRLRAARPSWRPQRPAEYCYLLGLYLGDGCVYVSPRGFATIVVTLDASYPGIVEQAMTAFGACFPDTPAHRFRAQREALQRSR